MHMRLIALLSLGAIAYGFDGPGTGDARAERLVAQARAAIGGAGKIASVRGLIAIGTFKKQMPDIVQTGDLQVDVLLPDKMLRSDSVRPRGEGVFVMLRGLNGDRVLRTSKILNAGPGARMSQPPLMGGTEALAIAHARAELARFLLAFLLAESAALPLEFADAAVAESPEGVADVVTAKGANGFVARLFLDQRSHRPLMLTYRGFDTRMFPAASQRAAPASRGAPSSSNPSALNGVSPQAVDLTLFLDDYRGESGLLMPHHASLAVDGTIDEDWTFKTIRLNPAFGPDAFSGK